MSDLKNARHWATPTRAEFPRSTYIGVRRANTVFSMTPSVSMRAPDDQGVTFVELFFDLVFVFAITNVTGLVLNNLSVAGAWLAVLVFWMIWWAWTQFTWALNPADTDHSFVRIAALSAGCEHRARC